MAVNTQSQLPIHQWKVIDYDGTHYELQNLTISASAELAGIGAASSAEEELASILFGLSQTRHLLHTIIFAECDRQLQPGETYRGRLSGDPQKLAAMKKFPKLIICDD